MNCAIYARKSTPQAGRDDEDKSVARQIDNARAFAAARGWHVDDTHIFADDEVSGAEVEKLRAKQRMLDLIRAGRAPFSVLIMQAADRLSRRDGDEAFGELKAIARAGIDIWFYADATRFEYGTFTTNTMGSLRAEFAAEFRRVIAHKTHEAMVRKARAGHVTGGVVFGYDNVRLNSHTERRINQAEAATVVRMFELYAHGAGLAAIAHELNSARSPAPRAQQGRVVGWCPSSVREILKRPLYRGELVYGRTKKRDLEGTVHPTQRPESAWVRVPVPALQIVPPHLAALVDARFANQRERALRLHDGRLIGRPPGEGSPYLLTGLLRCGLCGGGMEVLSTRSGGTRRFHYRCYVARRKGAAMCQNTVPAVMNDTDEAVLAALERTVLHAAVVDYALEQTLARVARAWPERATDDTRAQLKVQLDETDSSIRRLTAGIAIGGNLGSLVAALESQERQRKDLAVRLEMARTPTPPIDAAAIRRDVTEYLAAWQTLVRGHVYQGQQILRRLIKGRLTMVPQAEGFYRFFGTGTVRPLLAGVIRNVASPSIPSWNQILAWLREMASLRESGVVAA